MKIIAITGTNGSGKGEVVEYFKQKGFVHLSAREFLTKELEKRNRGIERVSLGDMGNELRRQHGSSYVIESLYTQAAASGHDSILESVRALGEVDFLKRQKDFVLLAVDADPHVRYDRVLHRKSSTDNVSYEQFLAQEAREMSQTDPAEMNIAGCVKQADFKIMNNGSLEELRKELDGVFEKIT